MRFRGTVEFWFEPNDLRDADRLVNAADDAVRSALGAARINDPDNRRVLSATFYEPIDDAARTALDEEDLGHGIHGWTQAYRNG